MDNSNTITIRTARIIKGLSMRDMACRLGICEDTYRKIERKPKTATIEKAERICDILNVSMEQIFLHQISS